MPPSGKRADSQSRDRRPGLLAPASPSLMAEIVAFVLHSKKWWLAPILIAVLLLSLIAGLSGSGLAPLMYTLF